MRNPNKIEPFLNTLKECWKRVSNWRFGQLIENVKRAEEFDDLFYIENDKPEDISCYIFH